MLCTLKTAALVGVDAVPVEVEVDVSGGLPGFHLVGLPDGAVREGGVRIRAAVSNSGFDLGSVRITVNLAPADLRKDGAAFDLPIALGSIAARGLADMCCSDLLYAGELALDGRVRPIPGVLSLCQSAKSQGLRGVVVPEQNVGEALLVGGAEVYGVASLTEALEVARGMSTRSQARQSKYERTASSALDFAQVRGQAQARVAAEIAAAGGHHLMLIGPPGSGKTMIAQRLPTVMPPLSHDEALETTKIHSAAGTLGDHRDLTLERPFRAPHHSCSGAGLVGGGSRPVPGEVSLAHNGVLFLDELPEFARATLDMLRQPIEDRQITVVRARYRLTFPANFMLVGAMNPCPCGYRATGVRTCVCGEQRARQYVNKISGPLLDRFDVFSRVDRVPAEELFGDFTTEPSSRIAQRVLEARERQQARLAASGLRCNAQMTGQHLQRFAAIDQASRTLLKDYARYHAMSARAVHRTCRVARTVADLAQSESVTEEHVALALTLQHERWLTDQ